eukprot:778578-Prymnesium_polylepis.2
MLFLVRVASVARHVLSCLTLSSRLADCPVGVHRPALAHATRPGGRAARRPPPPQRRAPAAGRGAEGQAGARGARGGGARGGRAQARAHGGQGLRPQDGLSREERQHVWERAQHAATGGAQHARGAAAQLVGVPGARLGRARLPAVRRRERRPLQSALPLELGLAARRERRRHVDCRAACGARDGGAERAGRERGDQVEPEQLARAHRERTCPRRLRGG